MTVARSNLDPRVAELRSHGMHGDDELELGDEFGPYLVLRRLGRGRLGSVYLARSGSDDVRLKVLRRDATYDRTGLQRFLAASRLVESVESSRAPRPGVPQDESTDASTSRIATSRGRRSRRA